MDGGRLSDTAPLHTGPLGSAVSLEGVGTSTAPHPCEWGWSGTGGGLRVCQERMCLDPTSHGQVAGAVGLAQVVLREAGVLPLVGPADVVDHQHAVWSDRHPARGHTPFRLRGPPIG